MSKNSVVRDTVALSGWLFADLLLGIGLVFFVADSRGAPSKMTPTPTYTPTSTRTPTPSRTPAPGVASPTSTRTPTPTVVPSLPTPTLGRTGLNRLPYNVSLRMDPDSFLRNNGASRAAAEAHVRDQIRACFAPVQKSRVGMVLATGTNPDPANGRKFAQSALALLQNEYSDLVAGAAFKDFFNIAADDPVQNGVIDLEIYFLDDPQFETPTTLLGTTCTPPPETWCMGDKNSQKVLISNWSPASALVLRIDGKTYSVKSSSDGVYRTIGCVMLSAGPHTWAVGSNSNTFNIANGSDSRLEFCTDSGQARACPSGNAPSSTGPGTQLSATPTRTP